MCPESDLKLCNISPNTFSQELFVLSSAKLRISDFQAKKNISFMKMLNNKGPTELILTVFQKLHPTSH